jgi:hypothetical protein
MPPSGGDLYWRVRLHLRRLAKKLLPGRSGRRLADVAEPIDVVYTWVDGDDPEFQRALRHHAPSDHPVGAAGPRRFRDSDELRFSLRSLEAHVPWAGRVFLVTNGQVPHWLRRDHPRLRLVRHDEIFPDASHLPTFNSAAIEAHLHRIPGVSRRFLYLNDDFFFGRRVARDHYIAADGRPRIWVDWWELPAEPGDDGELVNQWLAYTRGLLVRRLGPRRLASPVHGPILLDRDALAHIEAQWRNELARTSAARFRTGAMAMPHVLYAHSLAASGDCELPVSTKEHCAFVMFRPPLERVEMELDEIRRVRPSCFCINDDWDGDPAVKAGLLRRFLEDYFPVASSFEVDGPD